MSSVYGVAIKVASGWVTPECTDVSFSWEVNGGPTVAQFGLSDPSARAALGPDVPVRISLPDGSACWTGFVTMPGREASGTDSATVTCVGAAVLPNERGYVMPYLVNRLDAWRRDELHASKTNARTEVTTHPYVTDLPALVEAMPDGTQVGQNDVGRMRFTALDGTGFTVGYVRGNVIVGSDTNPYWQVRLTHNPTGDPAGTAHAVVRTGQSTQYPFGVAAGTSTLPLDQPWLVAEHRYLGAGSTTGNLGAFWAAWWGMGVAADLKTYTGQRATPWQASYILASDVVGDLIGRWLAFIDPARVIIAPTAFQIDTLDYQNHTTPAQVLDDLTVMEPDYYWMMGLANPEDDRHAFLWGAWPSTPRYIVDAATASVSEPGGGTDLANRVVVQWTDWLGRKRAKVYDATPDVYPLVSGLSAQSRVREMRVSLADEYGSQTVADRVGPLLLQQVAATPYSATVTTAARVMDTVTGRMVRPDEVRPGNLVAISGLDRPREQRCTAVECREGVATYTLGRPRLSTDQILARVTRPTVGR